MALTFNGKEVNTVNFNNNVGYTVVGNPTINAGVVSGFSADDYLRILNDAAVFSSSSTFEIITKFKMSSMEGWKIINKMWSTPTNYQGGLSTQNGKVKWYIYSTDVSTSMTCDTTLLKDVWYYAKQTKINNVYSVSWSNDGVTWYDTKEVELADAGFYHTFLYGSNQGLGNENLSIDLNETYIKVNDITWFNGKQQASPVVNEVYLNRNVGYTIVGSPTIVDGVVSGLSSSDYLQVFNFEQYKPFEFVLKIYTGTRQSDTCYLIRSNGLLLYWIWNYKLAFFLRNTDNQQIEMVGTTQLLANTNYWVKMQYDGQTMYLYLSTDGINYNLENSTTINAITNSYITKIGEQKSSGAIFNGSINLNETYIKVNGVTWFNGKQTATTPVWTRSV